MRYDRFHVEPDILHAADWSVGDARIITRHGLAWLVICTRGGGVRRAIILGRAHDLTESVRVVGERCDYVRVTLRAYREIAGE
jgi:hypothetical protein